ncbi:hypothetical protein ACOMHN_038964 [Nucella lapillus]
MQKEEDNHVKELKEKDVPLIQVEEYIKKAAATPRHLEDLCVTWVSQLVGYREDRKQAVENLDIPEYLKDRVLLNDVCEEFETGVSSILDQKKDPPNLIFL